MDHPRPRESFKSPRFAQPATFMRLPHVTDASGLDVAIVGVPFDGGTSYRTGARLGPREIRAQSSLIRPYSYFQKVAPFDRLKVADVGDVDAPPTSIEKAYAAIEQSMDRILGAGAVPLVVGGDHRSRFPSSARSRASTVRSPSSSSTPTSTPGTSPRRQVLPRHAVPPRHRRGAHRGRAVRPGRDPRADVRRGRLRLPPRAPHHDDRHRSRQGRGRRSDDCRYRVLASG